MAFRFVGPSELTDAQWLREQYVVRDLTAREIGERLGVSPNTVLYWLKKQGVPIRGRGTVHRTTRKGMQKKNPYLWDVDWLRERYVNQQQDMTTMASEADCGVAGVCNALRRAGISARTPPVIPELADAAWLRRRYWMEDGSTTSIGAELGCSTNRVRQAMIRLGLPLRAKGTRTVDGAKRVAAARRRHSPTRQTLSTALRREAGGSCVLCGTSDHIELHHVNGIRSDNRASNLLPLCSDHHMMAEWFIRKATPGILACADDTPAADFPPQLRLILESRSSVA